MTDRPSEESVMRDEIDAYLTTVFHDVPVPAGLAGRLLDSLAASRSLGGDQCDSSCDALLPCVEGNSPIFAETKIGTVPKRRRVLGWAAALLAVAAGLLLAVWLRAPTETRVSEQLVLDEAIQSFDLGAKEKDSVQWVSKQPAPAEYPLSSLVRHSGTAKWRSVDRFLGHRGVAYDLSDRAGGHAVLYVVDRDVDRLGTTPARHPFTTAGYCASAWQEGGLLYVLVVQGNRSTYEGYLNLPRGPMV
jgi:hypothetical protein